MRNSLFVGLISVFVILPTIVVAQYREFGIGVGAMSYTGDLIRGYDFSSNRPGAHIFYKRNTYPHVSFRYQVAFGKITGSDDDPIDVVALQRDAEFDITIVEGSYLVEYNFLNFRQEGALTTFTPYFFGGVGLMRMFGVGEKNADFSEFQPVIPFGVGIKKEIGQQFNLNVEFGARKTFTDYIDNVSGGDRRFRDFNYGNEFDSDWYYYANVSVSYLLYTLPCPFPYN